MEKFKRLLSRKFLLSLGGVISGSLLAFGVIDDASQVDKITGMVIAALSALGFIVVEGQSDKERAKKEAADE